MVGEWRKQIELRAADEGANSVNRRTFFAVAGVQTLLQELGNSLSVPGHGEDLAQRLTQEAEE